MAKNEKLKNENLKKLAVEETSAVSGGVNVYFANDGRADLYYVAGEKYDMLMDALIAARKINRNNNIPDAKVMKMRSCEEARVASMNS